MQLWRELREQQGYSGSRALVWRWVAQHRHLVPKPDVTVTATRRRGRPPSAVSIPPPAKQRRLSARKAAWLLVRRSDELEAEEQQLVERLCQHAPSVDTAYHLAQDFIRMVRQRQAEKFEGWLLQATASDIPEVASFAAGLERDKAAVVAALSLPYSNGQVEGQVNRLKLIKCCMYGRAKFDLLRRRVRQAATTLPNSVSYAFLQWAPLVGIGVAVRHIVARPGAVTRTRVLRHQATMDEG